MTEPILEKVFVCGKLLLSVPPSFTTTDYTQALAWLETHPDNYMTIMYQKRRNMVS